MTKFIFTGQLQARSLLLKVGEGADLETPKNLDMPKKRGGERGPPLPPPPPNASCQDYQGRYLIFLAIYSLPKFKCQARSYFKVGARIIQSLEKQMLFLYVIKNLKNHS